MRYATYLLTAAAVAMSAGVSAQNRPDRDDRASAAETRRVQAELAKIGCRTSKPIEKENGIFEADDIDCPRIGRFDAKLTSDFRIRSLTRDE